MRAFAVAFAAYLSMPTLIVGQEIQSIPKTADAAKESFLENAPLAEVRFNEARFNAKQQRMREHYLPTPLGPAPAGERREADVQPNPTDVSELEAGLGVAVRQNKALTDVETNNDTSNVCEPSLAVRGREILFTGNWFAAFSTNGGATFNFRNPETSFPTIPNRPFCCDQVAIYIPSHDLMVWFLQYGKDTTGNTVRLAVASGADIAAERWRYYDFTPQNVGSWSNEWFDYPDLAHSDQHLFVTTNCFTLSNSFARSVCLRIPLSELASYSALNYRYFDRTDVGSLRPVQGAGSTMYIGTHENTGSIRVYSWTDASTSLSQKSFAVQTWTRGGASAPCPDGRDWLGFVDGRITGAWAAGSTQGFAWTAAQEGNYTYPHVRVAVTDYNAGTVIRQPHIWNGAFAFAYPGATANAAGQVGVCLSYGGNTLFPNSAVGVSNGPSWSLVGTATGTHGPDRNRWGDYQSVRLNGQDRNRFASATFSLAGGPTRTDIVARLVQFDSVPTESGAAEAIMLAQPARPSLSPLARSIVERSFDAPREESKIKFAKGRLASNRNRRDQILSLSRSLNTSADQKRATMAVIPLTESPALQSYSDIAALPDIGEYFFSMAESVCEPDERLQINDTSVAPWNGNCQLIITLSDGSRARGTGWFLTPQMIVTAGHCVHEGEGGAFFPQIEVIPGMNGPMRPFGSQTVSASNLRASTGWKEDGKQTEDYGAIKLNAPFAGVTATPAGALPDLDLQSSTLTLSGYPADKPTGTQWVHSGVVSLVQPRRLHYMIDTFGGHSGSAVTIATPTGRVAVGIHNYGGCPNKCTRITSDILTNLQSWQSEP